MKIPPTSSWKQILLKSITTAKDLCELIRVDEKNIEPVIREYPMRINPYYLGLIRESYDPIYKQCIPDKKELELRDGEDDPLEEEENSPAPSIIHKYPDRVLFYISNQCAVYCRFCNRKRKVGKSSINDKTIKEGLSYIKKTKGIHDVLLSGGDPLMLSDEKLIEILNQLREIPHINIIRIGTRVPCTLPHRITPQLVERLKKFHPLYINTHFNHPMEITPLSKQACTMLADAGIPLGCQTVLLRGINDDPHVIQELMYKLISIRVRPYYLFYPDKVKGTAHFWIDFEKGLEIFSSLHGHISGLCVPKLVLDLPHAGGKVPIYPDYIIDRQNGVITFRNYLGKTIRYKT